MKFCPTCKANYPDDANFCPKESCATPTGPQRLHPVPAAASAAPESKAGGRFQLGPRLGGGSTGEIYRATDTQTGAQVAYKIVSSDVLPNPAAVARAEREFKQLMRVQSPRIAAVIDCGKTPDERLYVAMELCEGESLDRVLRAGATPLGHAKNVVAQIGQALLEAQKAGIVHRDVSPKNVLVSPAGDVKVINFPIAKPLNDKAAGVAAYLSPEQVQGKPVDQRSNTYSLACVFYHLLTGEPPFQGTPDMVLDLHLASPPLAPSQRRPEASLTPEVDRVVLKALDKSSSRRHLTLRLFLSEVEGLTPAPGAPGAQATGKEAPVGFAKTMLFAGGQAEVANLVAKAIASRSGSPAGGVPVTAPIVTPAVGNPAVSPVSMTAPTPPGSPAVPTVTPVRSQPTPVATAATVAAMPTAPDPAASRITPRAPMPATNGSSAAPSQAPARGQMQVDDYGDRVARLTPPPVTPYPPPSAPQPQTAVPMGAAPGATAPMPQQPAAGAAAQDGGKGGKSAAFRETLWFKKGDVEHMIAEARAKMANQGAKVEPEVAHIEEDVKPVEDRYVDDGSVTADDRKKFSLRTGGTATAVPTVRPSAVPGESMTEQDVIREVSGSRRAIVIAVAAIVVAAVVAVVLMMMRGRPVSSAPPKPPAAAAVQAPPPPAPAAPAGVKPPEAPTKAGRRETKIVAAPPSGKRSDGSDKRARRKAVDRKKRR
jgi:eukaryotic-like serine/threonine-protein kinase